MTPHVRQGRRAKTTTKVHFDDGLRGIVILENERRRRRSAPAQPLAHSSTSPRARRPRSAAQAAPSAMRALLVLAPAPAAQRRASGRPQASPKTTIRLGRRDGAHERCDGATGAGLASLRALPCRWDRVGAWVKRSPIAASIRASASAAEAAGGRGGGGGPEDEARRRVGKTKKGGVVRKLPRSPPVPWEERFEQLEAYHEVHGHTRVRQGEDIKLAIWVGHQRQRYRRGKLEEDRRRKLASLGFVFDTGLQRPEGLVPATWEERFEQLRAYHAKHGHTRVSLSEDLKLFHWAVHQRKQHECGRLSEDQIGMLAAIDFDFTKHAWSRGPDTVPWEKTYQRLRGYHAEHGHTRVSNREDQQLAKWVSGQRQKHRLGELRPERREKLESLGFDFSPQRESRVPWEERFGELQAYHAEHGHVRVSKLEDQKLAQWVLGQRKRHRLGKLRPERREKLESLGFDCSPHQSVPWEERFDELQAYHAEHGHTRVSEREDQQLAKWVRDQRRKHRLGKLRPERREKLESLGFDFSPQSVPWEERFDELEAYHSEHGHTRVSEREDLKLAKWVWQQRYAHKRGKLRPECREKLESLGFGFSPQRESRVPWEERFDELETYHAEHGHTRVSEREDLKLAQWVLGQRKKHRLGKLRPERREKLESLGFDFSPQSVPWEERFDELEAYHSEHGHTRVSEREDLKLAKWVWQQRYAHKRGKLRPECREKLESLGFGFSPQRESRVPWEERFDELETYHAEHGHIQVSEREDLKLAKWVRKQREQHRLGKLRPERREKLESLGFDFSPRQRGRRRHSLANE